MLVGVHTERFNADAQRTAGPDADASNGDSSQGFPALKGPFVWDHMPEQPRGHRNKLAPSAPTRFALNELLE